MHILLTTRPYGLDAYSAVPRIEYDTTYTVHMLSWLALPHLMSRPNALHRPMSNACIKCTLHESSRSTQESSRDIGVPGGLAENSPPAGIPFEHAHTARVTAMETSELMVVPNTVQKIPRAVSTANITMVS